MYQQMEIVVDHYSQEKTQKLSSTPSHHSQHLDVLRQEEHLGMSVFLSTRRTLLQLWSLEEAEGSRRSSKTKRHSTVGQISEYWWQLSSGSRNQCSSSCFPFKKYPVNLVNAPLHWMVHMYASREIKAPHEILLNIHSQTWMAVL